MASRLPLARTNAEAHIYMDLHRCTCGEGNFARTSSVIEVDGDLASRYVGICPGCGQLREFTFAIPRDVRLPPPGSVSFGYGGRSELLDAGEWLFVADRYARATPGNYVPGTEEGRLARQQLATAAAAMGEVLAFVPEGADAVPYESLRTQRGRAVSTRNPAASTRTGCKSSVIPTRRSSPRWTPSPPEVHSPRQPGQVPAASPILMSSAVSICSSAKLGR